MRIVLADVQGQADRLFGALRSTFRSCGKAGDTFRKLNSDTIATFGEVAATVKMKFSKMGALKVSTATNPVATPVGFLLP